jgi:hypothetical protein
VQKQHTAKKAAAKLKKSLGLKDCDDLMHAMDQRRTPTIHRDVVEEAKGYPKRTFRMMKKTQKRKRRTRKSIRKRR